MLQITFKDRAFFSFFPLVKFLRINTGMLESEYYSGTRICYFKLKKKKKVASPKNIEKVASGDEEVPAGSTYFFFFFFF